MLKNERPNRELFLLFLMIKESHHQKWSEMMWTVHHKELSDQKLTMSSSLSSCHHGVTVSDHTEALRVTEADTDPSNFSAEKDKRDKKIEKRPFVCRGGSSLAVVFSSHKHTHTHAHTHTQSPTHTHTHTHTQAHTHTHTSTQTHTHTHTHTHTQKSAQLLQRRKHLAGKLVALGINTS